MKIAKLCCISLTILVSLLFIVTMYRIYENKRLVKENFYDVLQEEDSKSNNLENNAKCEDNKVNIGGKCYEVRTTKNFELLELNGSNIVLRITDDNLDFTTVNPVVFRKDVIKSITNSVNIEESDIKDIKLKGGSLVVSITFATPEIANKMGDALKDQTFQLSYTDIQREGKCACLKPGQFVTLDDLVENSEKERQRWARDFFDQTGKQEHDFKRHSKMLNQIIKEREDLKKLVEESKKNISQQTNKFTEGIKKLGEFHDNYQLELENVLKRKQNLATNLLETRQKVQNSRLQKLQQKMQEVSQLRNKITEKDNNEALSVKCLGTGDRLNIEPIMNYDNPTGRYLVFLNDGCLRYQDRNTYDTTSCDAAPESKQQFIIDTVENYEQYNEILNKINDGTKKLVFENDDIVYPFKVVSPLETRGECLNVDDDGSISIEPCRDTANQRFRTSQLPSSKSCKA